ncbi:MAG: DNA-binding protein [Acidimicrobiia bacterium]|nr:DNA-binding protein [Acidimicrobiia bacterium]
MARSTTRTQSCDRSGALTRLAQAEAFLDAAELVVDDDSDVSTPSVAASLAVLAGIAASDAACCARLGVRARGQSHTEAAALLGTVEPGGAGMAKDLQRLLNRKDDSQYGLVFVSAGEASRMVGWAKRLLGHARRAVEA